MADHGACQSVRKCLEKYHRFQDIVNVLETADPKIVKSLENTIIAGNLADALDTHHAVRTNSSYLVPGPDYLVASPLLSELQAANIRDAQRLKAILDEAARIESGDFEVRPKDPLSGITFSAPSAVGSHI